MDMNRDPVCINIIKYQKGYQCPITSI